MMYCPYCVQGKTIVIDSRWDQPYKTIRRKRHCLACNYRWLTLEVDLDQITSLVQTENAKNESKGHPTEGKPSIDSKDTGINDY